MTELSTISYFAFPPMISLLSQSQIQYFSCPIHFNLHPNMMQVFYSCWIGLFSAISCTQSHLRSISQFTFHHINIMHLAKCMVKVLGKLASVLILPLLCIRVFSIRISAQERVNMGISNRVIFYCNLAFFP